MNTTNLTRRDMVTGMVATSGVMAKPAVATHQKTWHSRWTPVDAAIDRALEARAVPGAVVMICKGDETLYARAAGRANFETSTPMALGSVCRIGSVTKQFTAAAILLLAMDGKLSLDDPLSRFIPEFPKADRISLRRMLNHTSGLGNYTSVKLEQFLQDSRLDYDEGALLKVIEGTNPLFLFDPGDDWSYSNSDYVLLGIVVKRASGQSYKAFLRSRLFAPHGLSDTSADNASDIVLNRASGYSPDSNTPTGFRNASFISMTYPGGAGALRSTAPDLCRWSSALHSGKVLRREDLKAMLTPGTLSDGSVPRAKRAPGTPKILYGFGVGLDRVRGHFEVAHQGGIQGFYADLRTYPELGVTFAILINGDGIAGAKPSGTISSAIQNVLLA
ncbi:MAG TPA: serine hydrolase domain-containing protein [Croceibacterium sp.]|nr:serine hydrolase domain-containing protein [Croceibacterium sp.]